MPICLWCGAEVEDGREESGYKGTGPDWMVDGDFGCDLAPGTSEDGCGGHFTLDDARRLYLAAEESSVLFQAIAEGYPDIAYDSRFARTWGALRSSLGVS